MRWAMGRAPAATAAPSPVPSPDAAADPRAAALAARFRTVTDEGLGRVREALVRDYFGANTAYLETDEGRTDLAYHLTERLDFDRTAIVRWLDGVRPLAGARILEIGCGTGSSTVALAEQGARVVAIDLVPEAVQIAQVRCGAYGLPDVVFHVADASALPPGLGEQPFDLVIFFASLEHMIFDERLRALQAAWRMLPPGGLLCLTDTPNRLWFFDTHTALLPFFHWLPDDVALAYSRFSSRPSIRDTTRDGTPEAVLAFQRYGRGVSFHEFELALGPLAGLTVRSCRETAYIEWVTRERYEDLAPRERFARVLMELAPEVHPGFMLPSLELAFEKT